jgi:asparagine synthase (glutamine-hydrolysing)
VVPPEDGRSALFGDCFDLGNRLAIAEQVGENPMCGLIAIQQTLPRLAPDQMDQALEVIAHRGPNHRARWLSNRTGLALGHVRLSIIGLENGDQPIFDAIGSLACVVNGEFYGYRDIRRRLLHEGRRFSTESDSEIALHLYDTMGADFVHELRGEFALAIADEQSGRLIAARDRFGIKPLFYAVHEGAVLLASEIKALLALGVPARWSHAGFIAEQFSLRTNHTIFASIHAVPPGCLLIAEQGCVTIRRYWDTQYPVTEELSRSAPDDQAAIAGFREILETSVADRLVADVEVACYLSGGMRHSRPRSTSRRASDQGIHHRVR